MKKIFNIRYALRHLFTRNSLSRAYAHTRPSLCRRAIPDTSKHQDHGSRTGGPPPDASPLYPLIDTRPRAIAPPTLALRPESGPGPAACGRRRLG